MKKRITNIFILCILILIISIMGVAYAKYRISLKGETTTQIATVICKINGQTDENFTINLATTRKGIEQEKNVQEGCVGPGTAGAFEIEIDAKGAQVSLLYDINMGVDYGNNETFPKNLIFYSDAEMKNAIYHSDNNIKLNGFIAHDDDNKVKKQMIYWKWDYETGQTQEEKDSNDIADSLWMGKSVSLSVDVSSKQVNENPLNNQYAVTFDANGGTLQEYGNATQATKFVNYGEEYGELPVPTREGYTFAGWNGKNLFDMQKWLNSIPASDPVYHGTYVSDGNQITITATDTDAYTNTWNTGVKYLIKVKPNTVYTLSWKSDNWTVDGWVYVFMNSEQPPGYIMFFENDRIGKKITFTTTNDAKYITLRVGVHIAGNSITYRDIQLEEGTTATEYEPYHVTDTTTVDQSKNHTLTAIWEKNSRIITNEIS